MKKLSKKNSLIQYSILHQARLFLASGRLVYKTFIYAFLLLFILTIGLMLFTPEYKSGERLDSSCNVLRIPLHGALLTSPQYIGDSSSNADPNSDYSITYSQELTQTLESADDNSDIKAVILDIDSPGGTPVAAEEVSETVTRMGKPVVALIRSSGNSAAYFVASAADKIFASATSDVGSIGVTISYLDNVEKNKKEGLTYHQLSAGLYKDMLDPDKSLTPAEEKIVMSGLESARDIFVRAVAKNRHLDESYVRTLATGQSFTGLEALDNKLIDSIGGIYDVEKYLQSTLGGDIKVCWKN